MRKMVLFGIVTCFIILGTVFASHAQIDMRLYSLSDMNLTLPLGETEGDCTISAGLGESEGIPVIFIFDSCATAATKLGGQNAIGFLTPNWPEGSVEVFNMNNQNLGQTSEIETAVHLLRESE